MTATATTVRTTSVEDTSRPGRRGRPRRVRRRRRVQGRTGPESVGRLNGTSVGGTTISQVSVPVAHVHLITASPTFISSPRYVVP
ncbi:hypothetical protein D8S78_10365 [Natrialba swarupiae]|nr:hypothetical protein [Natrialba swarupiae]